MKMVALKSMTYAGKRINVGDEFEAKRPRDAMLLRAVGKADISGAQAVAPQPARKVAAPEPVKQAQDEDDDDENEASEDELRDNMRKEAEALGIDVDGRWGVKRLNKEIDKAKKSGRYARRDMRASD